MGLLERAAATKRAATGEAYIYNAGETLKMKNPVEVRNAEQWLLDTSGGLMAIQGDHFSVTRVHLGRPDAPLEGTDIREGEGVVTVYSDASIIGKRWSHLPLAHLFDGEVVTVFKLKRDKSVKGKKAYTLTSDESHMSLFDGRGTSTFPLLIQANLAFDLSKSNPAVVYDLTSTVSSPHSRTINLAVAGGLNPDKSRKVYVATVLDAFKLFQKQGYQVP